MTELLLDKLDKPATEPALQVGTLTGTVAGLMSLVVYFVPNLLTDKQLLIIAVAAAFLVPIVSAVFTRGKVWSPASVQAVIDEAVEAALLAARTQQPQPLLRTSRPMTEQEAADFAARGVTVSPSLMMTEPEKQGYESTFENKKL